MLNAGIMTVEEFEDIISKKAVCACDFSASWCGPCRMMMPILEDTQNSLLVQYASLLEVDNIKLNFKKDGIEEIARIAVLANGTNENIGARRLHSIMETLLEDISFNATGDHPMIDINVDKTYVDEHLNNIVKKFDLSKYIL